jgi:hypothetical protein
LGSGCARRHSAERGEGRPARGGRCRRQPSGRRKSEPSTDPPPGRLFTLCFPLRSHCGHVGRPLAACRPSTRQVVGTLASRRIALVDLHPNPDRLVRPRPVSSRGPTPRGVAVLVGGAERLGGARRPKVANGLARGWDAAGNTGEWPGKTRRPRRLFPSFSDGA